MQHFLQSYNKFIYDINAFIACTFFIWIFWFGRKIPDGRYVDVRKPSTFSSFRPHEETVFIVHGFNGTARDKHMRYLKDGNCFQCIFFFGLLFVVCSVVVNIARYFYNLYCLSKINLSMAMVTKMCFFNIIYILDR